MQYENLVRQIHQANHSWHLAQLCDAGSALQFHFLKKKNSLQIELIQGFPSKLRFKQEQNEALLVVGIQLKEPVGVYNDACHIPLSLVNKLILCEVEE